MDKLIAFGDSFTWGSDMADQDHNTPSRSTWQALYANANDMDYVCYAKPGCSNQTILRTFFEKADTFNNEDLISVNFTWRDRYDILSSTNPAVWETLRPTGTEDSEYFKMYYKHIQSSIWDQIENLKSINLIINYLESTNQQYIITCIDRLIFDDAHHSSKLIKKLQSLHFDKITWFNDNGFHAWATDHNYPISPMWHPLEEAHTAAYEYIKDKI